MSAGSKRQGRINQRKGAAGERAATAQLGALGVGMIEVINVGGDFIKWTDKRRGLALIRIKRKASGDRRGVVSGTGRSVLVEAKSPEDTLKESDFEPHQLPKLREHAALGGLSLIAWAHPVNGVALVPYPNRLDLPRPYKSLGWAEALELYDELEHGLRQEIAGGA